MLFNIYQVNIGIQKCYFSSELFLSLCGIQYLQLASSTRQYTLLDAFYFTITTLR
jgi:hypothetical protein